MCRTSAIRVFAPLALALQCTFTPSLVWSAPFRSDQCAVIIASRPTLFEAHQWASTSTYQVDVIYLASNGYFAVSGGLIPKGSWRATVNDLKSRGLVPSDAYCSAQGIVSVAAMNSADAEAQIRAAQAAAAIQASDAARVAAERAAEQARAAAEEAEARARRAEAAAAIQIAPSNESNLDGASTETITSSGTGFRIARDGTLITNNHVIEGCKKITADGGSFRVLEKSTTFDLAVLRPESEAEYSAWLNFSSIPPRLNSDVIVAGYPLYGLLGGVNVTRGTITSLRGLAGDDSTMQISAPVQSGNSGGAVVDRYGRVVGVVVSKLDNDFLKEVAGVTAENVNFAIRGDILRLMLDRYEVRYEATDVKDEFSPEDLADKVTAATALVECHN